MKEILLQLLRFLVREKYDWNISDLGKNIKTKRKEPKQKIEQTKAKLKRPRFTGKEHTSQENKNSEYVTRRTKQRKSKNCSCKFTECRKLDENELEKAFEAFYKIGDSEKQKLNLLSNQDKKNPILAYNRLTPEKKPNWLFS